MFGVGKHAQTVLKELSEGGITFQEAMTLVTNYDRIHMRWQLALIFCALLLGGTVITLNQTKIKTADDCLLHYTKQGMSEDAAINIRWACDAKYGDQSK